MVRDSKNCDSANLSIDELQRQLEEATQALAVSEEQVKQLDQQLQLRTTTNSEKLRHSEDRYRRLIEGLQNNYVVYETDVNGNVTYISPSVQQVLGYPPELMIGHNWREFSDPTSPAYQQTLEGEKICLAGHRPAPFMAAMRTSDGELRLFEIQARPIFDSHGQVVATEGISKDITDQKRFEEELRHSKDELELRVAERTAELKQSHEELKQSEQRFRTLSANAPVGIFLSDIHGKSIYANRRYTEITGVSHEVITAIGWINMVHPEDRKHVQKTWNQAVESRSASAEEFRFVHPSGEVRLVKGNAVPMLNAKGQLTGYVGTLVDITDSRRSAEQLRDKELQLAHLSRLATMGEVVAGIAHEVNQPLHAAATFAAAIHESLEFNRPDAVQKAMEWSKRIGSQIERAGGIIRRTREFTKSNKIRIAQLNLSEIVLEALELVEFEARRRRIKIETHLATDLPSVFADRIQIQQVIVNLLTNAFESHEKKSGSEKLVQITTSHSKTGVSILVADNGSGLDLENERNIFDAFYTSKTDGMGMGLAISRGIAEAHFGKISAENNPQGGATFTFTLPLDNPWD